MTDTVHKALLALVAAKLQALPSVPASRVAVERASAVTRDECPFINVMPGDNHFEVFGSEESWNVLKATMAFSLKVHTRGDGHTSLADVPIGHAHQALMADPSLGGYAMRLLLVTSRPQIAEGDATAGTYELGYEATVLVDERTLAILQN